MKPRPTLYLLWLLAALLLAACGGAAPAAVTPSPTATPMPTAEPLLDEATPVVSFDDPSTWNVYLDYEMGFSFHFPSDRWTLVNPQDGRQLLLLYGDTGIALRVKFARQDDPEPDLQLLDGEVSDLVADGTVSFMGEEVERSRLVYEDVVDWVFYNAAAPIPRGDVLFSLALLSSNDYNAGEPAVVPADVQAEADRIVETFVLE